MLRVEWKRLFGGCREAVRTIDLPLLVALLILMGAGLAVLHSVSGPVAGQAAWRHDLMRIGHDPLEPPRDPRA